MKVGLFHPGTQHSRQTARALAELDRLAWFATSIYPSAGIARRWPAIAHFRDPSVPDHLVRSFGGEEWVERLVARLGLKSLARRVDRFGNRRFARRIADAAAREGVGLWGYDGSSAAAFADPRLGGAVKVLDRTIADWRSWNDIADRLQDRWPDWITGADLKVPETRIATDRQEYEGATHILCGAPFVAQTIAEHEGSDIQAKLRVLPYAHDDRLFRMEEEPSSVEAKEPIRFLFVGQLSLRKGLPILLEAFARLPAARARLTLAGDVMVRDAALARYTDRVEYVGRVSRSAMPDLMRRHHVLVLPSWFEGSAITLLEARAMGLAIVQTAAAGRGADADSGIVIGEPDVDALEDALAVLLDDPDRVNAMRKAAWLGAHEHTHAAYTRDIGAFLETISPER